MKQFNAELVGFPIDSDFNSHQSSCEQCKTFGGSPSELSGLCLEGSVLWKNENVTVIPKPKVEKDEHIVSKARLKQIMRYK